MQLPDVPMLGFRAMQAVSDLRATALRQPDHVLSAICARLSAANRAAGVSADDLRRILIDQGARLESEADRHLTDALLVAASQPDPDRATFVCATAILLADRLQCGLGQDDLGAYWTSFRHVYATLEASDRAAIVQGYLTGTRLGRVRMPAPVSGTAHLTGDGERLRAELLSLARQEEAALSAAIFELTDPVTAALAGQHLQAQLAGKIREPVTGDSMVFEPLLSIASRDRHPAWLGATALLLAEALRTGDAEGWFAITLWPERVESWLSPQFPGRETLLAGLRHLYESALDWAPMPDTKANPLKAAMPLLPAVDLATALHPPGARVG